MRALTAWSKRKVAAAGGIEACVAAMRRFPSRTDVQLAGCFLLGNVSVVASTRDKATAAGGVNAAVRALKAAADDDAQMMVAAATAIGVSIATTTTTGNNQVFNSCCSGCNAIRCGTSWPSTISICSYNSKCVRCAIS